MTQSERTQADALRTIASKERLTKQPDKDAYLFRYLTAAAQLTFGNGRSGQNADGDEGGGSKNEGGEEQS